MKRERTSPTPSPNLSNPSSPVTPVSTSAKRSKKVKSPTAKGELDKKISGGWTPESKAKLVDLIFTAGLSSIKLDEAASLIADATCRGRNNLRHKVIEYAANAPATGSSRKGKVTEDE